ncbi:hypothetical protein COT48_02325 [Candidatus Woesearchaeota archaeon CG08_land_8_20_14_0_20_47_9]|nr:MAG: hypothetical protein COT48_02325 [Candidatus Woesearchaeota archaeon CG08_land_8_20_14_0_20_47_9]
MGQQEVRDFLNKHRERWFTSTDIARDLNVSKGSVITNLSKLRKSKHVNFRPAKRTNQYEYAYKK